MAKKEQIKALLWFYSDPGSIKQHNSAYSGQAYFYNDLKSFISCALLGGGCVTWDKTKRDDFIKALGEGRIKVSAVVKNINSRSENSPFDSIQDGEVMVNEKVTNTSHCASFDIMDSYTRNHLGWWGAHCKLESPRDLTEDELKTIHEAIDAAKDYANLDNVFNLFALLCCAKGVVWNNYYKTKLEDEEGDDYEEEDDERERSHLGFTTFDLYDSKDVEARERVARRIAACAYTLTTALTGCQLKLKEHPEISFVDGLMAARYLQNDQVKIVKVGKPTMTLKELLEAATCKEPGSDGMKLAAKVCLEQFMDKAMKQQFEDLMPVEDVTIIKTYQSRIKELKGLDNCVVLRKKGDPCNHFVLYMWGSTAVAYEMAGDLDKFITIINNK